jgi:formylglycine-generating enzyme required for sulfatase activity
MVSITPGTFDMGAADGLAFERPVHRVTLSKPFALSKTEVTFDQWDDCVAGGGCSFKPDDRGWGRGNRPVINVSWNDAKQYVDWLSATTGKHYRLPTEAEWEYAARGGTRTAYWWGAAAGIDHANCHGCGSNGPSQTTPAGSFPANAFGLVDMAGNAAEWVADCWHDGFKGAPSDGSAWDMAACQERVLRGGSFANDATYVRAASRFHYDADVRYYANGFRVARDAP